MMTVTVKLPLLFSLFVPTANSFQPSTTARFISTLVRQQQRNGPTVLHDNNEATESAETTTASSSKSEESVQIINGDHQQIQQQQQQQQVDDDLFSKLQEKIKTINQKTTTIKSSSSATFLPEAPALSYDKFLTMQDKRVVVTIRYSGGVGLKPYFLTVAKKLKQSHPDVVLERRILPTMASSSSSIRRGRGGGEQPALVQDLEDNAVATFEVLVDGKVVIGKGRSRKQKVGNVFDVSSQQSRSVFVSMQELDVAISRARRRRRPSTLYGNDSSSSSGGGDDNNDNKLSPRLEKLLKKKTETGAAAETTE